MNLLILQRSAEVETAVDWDTGLLRRKDGRNLDVVLVERNLLVHDDRKQVGLDSNFVCALGARWHLRESDIPDFQLKKA